MLSPIFDAPRTKEPSHEATDWPAGLASDGAWFT